MRKSAGRKPIEARSAGRIVAAILCAAVASWMLAVAQEETAEGTAAEGGGGLIATLERLGSFYYAGDSISVRVGVFNTGESPYDNSKGLDLLGNIIVGDSAGGAVLERKPSSVATAQYQPSVIPPGGFFGFIKDLREVLPGLEKPGRYTARLQLGDLQTDPVPIIIIPRFDPAVPHRATIDTDFGTLTFDLLGREAPQHVENFYNLANQGYYDNSLVFAVVKGVHVLGGDTAGDGSSSPGYDLPLEIDPNLAHGRGTLSMLRRRNTDHGAQFLISLARNESLDGSLSIFGAMADGEEALTALENLPTSGQREQPYYRPIRQTRIRFIKVEPAPEDSKATAPPAESGGPAASD